VVLWWFSYGPPVRDFSTCSRVVMSSAQNQSHSCTLWYSYERAESCCVSTMSQIHEGFDHPRFPLRTGTHKRKGNSSHMAHFLTDRWSSVCSATLSRLVGRSHDNDVEWRDRETAGEEGKQEPVGAPVRSKAMEIRHSGSG
jgi:hypothetical protein